MSALEFWVTSPHGTEDLLMAEIAALGAEKITSIRSGAAFGASLPIAYGICLWSRIASRVFLRLGAYQAADAEQLYAAGLQFPWEDHLSAEATFAVDCSLRRTPIAHSRYAALKVKDAIADRFRERFGKRPSVKLDEPDVRFFIHVEGETVSVFLDLSGEGLYRRGYRSEGGMAPLKENLAAAILLRAGWPQKAGEGQALLDPLCGSGTLLIEGALMAGDVAPGLLRSYYGFKGWLGHDEKAWRELLTQAQERRRDGLTRLPALLGCDQDRRMVTAALDNANRAGLQGMLQIEQSEFSVWLPQVRTGLGEKGLIVANPPYGERLGDEARLSVLYASLGDLCRRYYPGWQLSVITGNPELAARLGLRAARAHSLRNGPIRARLFHYELLAPSREAQAPETGPASVAGPDRRDAAAEMFANRLRKNLKAARRWAKQEGVSCYRLYDADLPEYAVAIDDYEGRIHVQEYQPPSSVDAAKARARLQDVLRAISEVLEVSSQQIYLKQRRRQRGAAQYGRMGEKSDYFEVREGPCRLLVNLSDYLDTGLFLDHRPIRRTIMEMAAGRRFLNLFGYTGTASAFAAHGGARTTVTVDASRTYLDWARKNLELNGFRGAQHRQERADVSAWLQRNREQFDLIFLDPPTFSNSKDREGTFDVQRDHTALIRQAFHCLAPQGVLIFSTNHRRFSLDEAALAGLNYQDITERTIPWDFRRRPGIHRCWLFFNTAGLDAAEPANPRSFSHKRS